MEMSIGEMIGWAATAFPVLAGIVNYLVAGGPTGEKAKTNTVPPPESDGAIWTERLRVGLGSSREGVWGKLGALFSKGPSPEALEQAEELLYSADLGPDMVEELLAELKGLRPEDNVTTHLRQVLEAKLSAVAQVPESLFQAKPKSLQVVMIIGVNGAGKTTTIGKLATKLTRQGHKVMIAACDTFRAAAVDQLQVWADRSGAEMIRAKDGADPSGVAFEATQKAHREGFDYCLVDTAGRLHTNQALMDELAKTKRVMSKVAEGFPQQTYLVIDSITGQGALRQAQEFHGALGVDGLVLTKCDGHTRAGNAVALVDQLKTPIVFLGVGEDVDDLDRFNASQYLDALIGLQ